MRLFAGVSTCVGDPTAPGALARAPYCQCDTGYGGPQCEPLCDPPCQNGACVSPGQCACSVGWAGEDCSFSTCDGGTSVTLGTTYPYTLHSLTVHSHQPRTHGVPLTHCCTGHVSIAFFFLECAFFLLLNLSSLTVDRIWRGVEIVVVFMV
jgi:hypothetical protein